MSETPSDANEFELALASIGEHMGVPDRVLADAGYVNADAIERVQDSGTEDYVAISGEDHVYRWYDYARQNRRSQRKR